MQTTTVSRIAHLSDVHMLDPRPSRSRAGWSMGVRFLSFGRPLDALERRRKLSRALDVAKRSGADHFVISGDLTEIGAPEEFESFAEVLHDSRVESDRVTLVPGNHDAYTPSSWKSALAGPLAAFARGAANEPGTVVDRGGVCFLPLDVTRWQSIARSGGELTNAAAEALEKRVADATFASRAVVLVQHHAPFSMSTSARQWWDGLAGNGRLMDLLARVPNLHVLHGHLHHVVDRIVRAGTTRIFGAPAIVDDEDGTPRVRVYDVRNGLLESVGVKSH